MGFMDDRAHEVYSLGLIPESPANQKPEEDATLKKNSREEPLEDELTEKTITARTNCNGCSKSFQLAEDGSTEESCNKCAVRMSREELNVKMSNEITHL